MINNLPILSLCLGWPLLGALTLAMVKPAQARIVACGFAAIELLLTLLAAYEFNPQQNGFQFQELKPWISGLNVHYQLGVDGISILFLPMTALLTLMAILATWRNDQSLNRLHLALLLLLETATLGVFTALDLLLFFLFWELTLPPIFFLISLWGIGAERRQAAMKYTLYMLFGGVPVLFAIILLALNHAQQTGMTIPQNLSFNLLVLLDTPMDSDLQNWVLGLLMLGFAVKAPLFPFHTWLPHTAMDAPSHLTALLVGLKLGIYGIIRFAIPLAPHAAHQHRWLLAILGAITLIYAALIALKQTNLRRLLAYASISHVGLVLIGIASFNEQGLQGAVLQMLNFGLIASSLMLLSGMIQQRLGSTDRVHLGGLAKTLPRISTLFLLFALASLGIPGSSGFVAEFLLLVGTLASFPLLTVVVLFAAVLAAAYLLGYVRRGFWGTPSRVSEQCLQDLLPRELAILLFPTLLVIALGLCPQYALDWQKNAVSSWVLQLNHPYYLSSADQG